MNKKAIKKLTAAVLVSGTVASGAYVTYQWLNHSQPVTAKASQAANGANPGQASSENVATPVITNKNYEQIASFSLSKSDDNAHSYSLTINNADPTKGSITFADGKTTGVFEVGKDIVINVNIIDEQYTIQSVRVHSPANVNGDGVGNDNCGVNKLSDTQWSFQLPPETLPNGKPSPFYDGSHEIKVDVEWTLKNINKWEYTWMNGTDSGVYAITLEEDTVFDDEANSSLKMQTVLDSEGRPQANVIFRIYMNGHNLYIKNMTIPSGVQLMFINNKDNTVEPGTKTPMVSLTDDSTFKESKVGGGIGRWGSVDFSDQLLTILNLNTYRGWLS